MAGIRNFTINKNVYTFYNEFKKTYNGFSHISKLFKNEYQIASAKMNYLNRTWEYYQFQTSMKQCIDNYINELTYNYINDYKRNNNIKRMTKDKKDIVMAEIENLNIVKELRELDKQLSR